MKSYGRQRGVSLIIGLIMLVMITLVVVTSFNLSNSHLLVVNNAQVQTELESAANAAVERIISSNVFIREDGTPYTPPPVAISQFEAGSAGTTAQKTNVSVDISAACVKARILSNKESSTISKDCIWDPDSGGAYVEGKTSSASESLCADSLWNVRAFARAPHDARAEMEVNQGVGTAVARSSVPSNCGA